VRRLHAEVQRLRRENNYLKQLLRQARQVIKAQRKQLDRILAYAHQVLNSAGKKLQAGNLPRAQWAYIKAEYKLAQAFFQLAGADLATGILAAIAAVVG
jgi:small-conductance mechanosensitive channel